MGTFLREKNPFRAGLVAGICSSHRQLIGAKLKLSVVWPTRSKPQTDKGIIMFKFCAALFSVALVAGCSSNPSAFQSGWTNDTNENAYKECGSFRYAGHEYGNTLDKLVAAKKLTAAQANRAIARDVRVGDSECLAYAAYGLDRKTIKFEHNSKKQLVVKSVTYECKTNPVSCPGIRVTFVDGTVQSISPL
ncbi:hypothetical protein [Pseudomonas syringae]|uniref:hypothetical protein n=1 Tax=Pseudomonas syringae TaxID=317 RepID=UPI001BCEF93B|nr:hypothetical protein [Pseudomonas syringae]MBS7413374.1 hypothetical protein [Pseudomonas syringae]MBS7471200.1 hypothetical protein [Pseudomonas syringae]